jgi:hypothetical protein
MLQRKWIELFVSPPNRPSEKGNKATFPQESVTMKIEFPHPPPRN